MLNKEELLNKLRHLKRSIKNDPAVMARYDIDEDGRINGEEWDLARKETILGLESKKVSAQRDKTAERAESVLENIDAAGMEASDTASGYGPIRVESFWGAIAMFCLCQLYYFILFEGFVFISGVTGSQKTMLYVWFGILFLVSVSAQIEALIKIENYFSDKPFNKDAFHIASIEDIIKCLLAVLFGFFFILFCLGFYPFPSKPHQWWHTLLFYIFIWGLTVAAAKNLKGGIRSIQPLGLMNVIPVIMGFTFFTISAFLGDVFYFAGTFGMGFALIPVRPLLLCNQTKLLEIRKDG
jgi:hypothetical protein